MDDTRAFQLIDEIDAKLTELTQNQFLNPEIFAVLDNVEADRRAIDAARGKIGEALWLRLQDIAGSVYAGNIRRGEVASFYDVVSRLGTHQTKVMIMQLGFHQSANRDPEAERLFARSFATSVMAGVLAWQMGFRENSAQRAELGGLFLEIGRQMMTSYKKTIAPGSGEIDDAFIDTYHPYLAAKIVKRFTLPDYLQTIV
ncbi:MAG TPA: HDOD domain-containing protein, partial [Syntrophales bacterium]|nr:HDOD domain-containing protein [Syntrophales bacterium]